MSSKTLQGLPPFDIVLALGILHHLDDGEATRLLSLAKSVLKARGRLLCVDPCYIDGQSSIARLIISLDRGQNVRREAEYETLARGVFAEVTASVRHDLNNIPFTHLVMECTA